MKGRILPITLIILEIIILGAIVFLFRDRIFNTTKPYNSSEVEKNNSNNEEKNNVNTITADKLVCVTSEGKASGLFLENDKVTYTFHFKNNLLVSPVNAKVEAIVDLTEGRTKELADNNIDYTFNCDEHYCDITWNEDEVIIIYDFNLPEEFIGLTKEKLLEYLYEEYGEEDITCESILSE